MTLELKIETAEPVHRQIELFLRQKLAKGELPPGTRLPPTGELARLWRVDRSAIQRAVAPLVAQGYIERRPRRGTFVSHGAHNAHIALLFGPSLADESAHFYRAVKKAMCEEARDYKWVCRVYDGINPTTAADGTGKEEMLDHLKRDIQNYGFKGLAYVGLRTDLVPMLERECRLPIVGDNEAGHYDIKRFVEDSVACLAQHGCRRLVFIPGIRMTDQPSWTPTSVVLQDEAGALGLPPIEAVTFPALASVTGNEAEIQRQMMRRIGDWRARSDGMPDGAIVVDDIMMRAVALALLATGVKVPEDLRVVTLATDGVRLHYGVPVTRYEFHVGDRVKAQIRLLWKRILNDSLPPEPLMWPGHLLESE
ncbi:MAG: GntR family transcriptional regulator [Kiritimatiellae bacterium]|nr:GntR family transcriptional regulator [Kiritimatiellia bacterium]